MNGVLVYVIGWFKSAINDKIWTGVLVYVIGWLRVQLIIKYEWGISICNRMI